LLLMLAASGTLSFSASVAHLRADGEEQRVEQYTDGSNTSSSGEVHITPEVVKRGHGHDFALLPIAGGDR
jgi:hypothetical protein